LLLDSLLGLGNGMLRGAVKRGRIRATGGLAAMTEENAASQTITPLIAAVGDGYQAIKMRCWIVGKTRRLLQGSYIRKGG